MSTDSGTKGIDVSYAQGAIDWAQVRMSGVNFAMIRASRGYISEAKPMAKDVMFDYNITEATKVGINVGVYHYLYAESVAEAKKEAKFFIETIKRYVGINTTNDVYSFFLFFQPKVLAINKTIRYILFYNSMLGS